ncbi:MAG: KamA family radical SAM protein [Deltaproteobacteria bacterium]|nr:KamA family radical SAM protein [Deltaproteobacteria bacterium]
MESESLLKEEAEPPGSVTKLIGPEDNSSPALLNNAFHSASVVLVGSGNRASHFKSSRSRIFRKKFYPQTTYTEWNDWRWQLRNRIRDFDALAAMFDLSEDERNALLRSPGQAMPLSITPYYASLLHGDNASEALRRTVIPVIDEYIHTEGESDDPLGEDHDSPITGIVHRYPDRVLFLVTDFCSTNCRYCTRSRIVGGHQDLFSNGQWEKGIDYIAANPDIRDVLISGGDPLTMADDKLEWLLYRLSGIPHVEIIRIGTKVPAVLPQRITPELTRMLKRYHPLFISIHATHPDELTPEMAQACTRLADAGIPLGSQTVLLSGINDDVETMKQLFCGLLKIRVRPYYLYQCDPISGSSHFRTPVTRGLDIIQGLRGHTSGYAVPSYVIDAPGGGGKVPLLPEYVIGRDGDDLLLKNYEGHIYRYPDCLGQNREIH